MELTGPDLHHWMMDSGQLAKYSSDEECTTLRQQLTHSDTLTEEWMVHSFTVAKVFIHAAAQN